MRGVDFSAFRRELNTDTTFRYSAVSLYGHYSGFGKLRAFIKEKRCARDATKGAG